MITRYVNTDSGSSTPVDPNTDPYDTAANALAALIAETDDITLICEGSTIDASLTFPNFSGYAFNSLTIQGNWVGASANYNSSLYTLQNFAFRHRGNITLKNLQMVGQTGGSGTIQIVSGVDYAEAATCKMIDVLIDCDNRHTGYTEVRALYNNVANLTIDVINCIIRRLNSGTTRYGVRNNNGVVNFYNSTVDDCQTGLRQVTLVQNSVVKNNTTDFNATTNIFNTASASGAGTDGITVSDWDAEFTDAANGDYTLLPGSQLRDAGLALPAGADFSEDVTGAARSQGSAVDVGPYEFASSTPTFTSAEINADGDEIDLNFSEAVEFGTAAQDVITLSFSGGVLVASYLSGDGTTTLTYSLSRVVLDSETGTYSFTGGADVIQSASSGADVEAVSDVSVTNSSTVSADTFAPTLFTDLVLPFLDTDGTTLSITYNENIQLGADGSTGFSLVASGGAVSLAYQFIGNNSIIFTTSRTIDSSETLLLSFTQPGDGLQDTASTPNNAGNFSNQVVDNFSIQDSLSPEFIDATINASGTLLAVQFSKNVSIGSGGSIGIVLGMSGGAASLTFSEVINDTAYYDIGRVILDSETGTIDYTQPGNGIESETAGNDVASFSGESVTNDSTQTFSVSTDAGSYEPSDTIVLTLTNFTETPTVTINGVAVSYTGDETGGTVTVPAYSAFLFEAAHQDTPWNTNITVEVTQTGGNAGATIQIVPPSGAEYFDFVTTASSFPSGSILSDDTGIEVGDLVVGRVIQGTLVSIGVDGVPVFSGSTTVGQIDYKVWDASISEWSNESSEFFELGVDDQPDSYSFTDVNGATLSTQYESNVLTINGIDDGIDISITGGEYRINGGAYTSSAGTIDNGDTVQLRGTSSGSFLTAADVVLTIGASSDTWTITTYAQDTTPNAFSFSDVVDAALTDAVESNIITVSGINSAAAISIDAGEYRINGGSYTSSPGTVNNGDTVQLRITSSGSNSTEVTANLTIGGVSDEWSVTTVAAGDTTPDAFSFNDQSGLNPSTVVESNEITVTGISAAAGISVVGGEFSINGGGYTSSPSTVSNNDTVRVRGTTSANYETQIDVVLTIGGVSDTFSLTTRAADRTPNAFDFVDVSDAAQSSQYTSNTVSISGIDNGTAISIVCGTYSINGAPFTSSPGTINNGDNLRLRVSSSASALTAVDVDVTIGTVTVDWTVTTGSAQNVVSIGEDNTVTPGESVSIVTNGINMTLVKQIVLDDGTNEYEIKANGTANVKIPDYVPFGTYQLKLRQY